MTHITLRMLTENNACKEQVALFRMTFGKSGELTEANWSKAINAGLDIMWLELFVEDSDEYHKIADKAWETYTTITNKAWVTYVRARSRARASYAEYRKVADKAYEKCRKIKNKACAEYEKTVCAALFVALRKL